MKTLNTLLYLSKFKRLWFVTNLLGITSFYQTHDYGGKTTGRWKRFLVKFYILFLLVGFQAINAFQILRRVQWSFKKLTTTANVILSTNTLVLVLVNFLVTYELNFNKSRSLEVFGESLLQLDYLLYVNIGITVDGESNNLALFVLHLIGLYMLALDFWVWYDTLGFGNYFYYIFDVFQRYRVEVIVLTLYVLISDFYRKIKTINSILKAGLTTKRGTGEVRVDLSNLKGEIPNGNRIKDLKSAVHCVGLAYGRICETCATFNEIFGWVLFVSYISFMLTFIAPVDVLITFEAKGVMNWNLIAWNVSLMMHAVVSIS